MPQFSKRNQKNDSGAPTDFLSVDLSDKDDSKDSYDSAQIPVKKKQFTKRFRKEWMDEPMFATWLQPVQQFPDRCYCAACNVVLIAGHSELEKHAAGKRHSLALESFLAENGLASNQEKLASDVDAELRYTMLNDTTLYDLGATKNKNAFQSVKNDTLQINIPKVAKASNSEPVTLVTSNQDRRQAKSQLKRKQTGTSTQTNLNIPAHPDPAKLIRLIRNESEEDDLYDEEEEDEDCEEVLPSSQQLLREMRAELAFTEKDIIQKKQKERMTQIDIPTLNGKIPSIDDAFQHIAEKELEARLNLVEEKRRQQMNIYKLQLLEMEARVKLAESAMQRETELHNLRLTHLHFQIQREQQGSIMIPDVEDATQAPTI